MMLSLILIVMVTAVLAYGAGARSGYWRGVARGQYVAGREYMHVMAHVLHGSPLPDLDPSDLDAAKKPGLN